jgi:hypothetical protein
MHVTEKELLFKATTEKVPKFNRIVFDSDREVRNEIGSINEILGPFNKYVFELDEDVFGHAQGWCKPKELQGRPEGLR